MTTFRAEQHEGSDMNTRDTRKVWTVEQVRALGVRTDLATACAAVLGIGRTKAWEASSERSGNRATRRAAAREARRRLR